jgi:hypothetical protein
MESNLEWVTATDGQKILGVYRQNFIKLAREGYFAIRAIPGTRRLYRREDIERLAQESVKPPQRASSVQTG